MTEQKLCVDCKHSEWQYHETLGPLGVWFKDFRGYGCAHPAVFNPVDGTPVMCRDARSAPDGCVGGRYFEEKAP